MTDLDLDVATQAIVLDEIFPHAPQVLWRTLTSGDLMARWLMPPSGFAAEVGNRFTFSTKPAGNWDGLIRCVVLEVVPNERLAYRWTGGHAGNAGYGSPLDTIVTFLLSPTERGTRMRLVHAGFVLPLNQTALDNMSQGWRVVLTRLAALADEQD